MKEKVTYRLSTILGGINPTECSIEEEFKGNKEMLAIIMMEKVPRRPLYVIFRKKNSYFPEVLDACANISCASDKVLEYALRYVQKKIKDGESPLFLESVIVDHTVYGENRFNRVRKRLEKKCGQ